jgi:hypothetical protein
LDAKKNAPATTQTVGQNVDFNAKTTDAHRAKGVVINASARLQKNSQLTLNALDLSPHF